MHSLNDISCMKENLVRGLDYDMMCKGTDHMDVDVTGKIVDMIKDLAQAEKDCMEKCYYETVVGAMVDHGFDNEHEIEKYGRMGYDTRRYSNGRYAPKGAGHYSPVRGGYTPMTMDRMPPYMMNQDEMSPHEYRMGYPAPRGAYGHSMDNYKNAKHYYTETKDPHKKEEMDQHAKDHVNETIYTFKEIWEDADPNLKRDMKGQLSKLVAEMQI